MEVIDAIEVKFTVVSQEHPFKKRLGTVLTLPFTVMLFNAVHPLNIPAPTAPLTVALFIYVQLANASSDTDPVDTLTVLTPQLKNAC